MKISVAIDLARKIMKNRPNYILCGSTALVIAKILPDREINDLDFVCSLDKFDPTGLKQYGDYGPQVNDGYLCYKITADGGFYYNVFVHENRLTSSDKIVDGIKIQSPAQMLAWKGSYQRGKDIKDLQEIARKM